MKKLLTLTLLTSSVLLTTGCNQDLFGHLEYNHIHIQLNAGEPIYHLKVKSWTVSYDDIEVKLEDGTSMFINGGYVLYEGDKCPLCNK